MFITMDVLEDYLEIDLQIMDVTVNYIGIDIDHHGILW